VIQSGILPKEEPDHEQDPKHTVLKLSMSLAGEEQSSWSRIWAMTTGRPQPWKEKRVMLTLKAQMRMTIVGGKKSGQAA